MESPFLRRDLSALTPQGEENFFIVDRNQAKGIHCRFGMRGVVAAAHFDGSRNFITLLHGYRRYLLAKPKNCASVYMYPRDHPSGRHSQVDWSDPDLTKFPKFPDLNVNEVILKAGDVMYMPSGWFHYVMSLNVNFQCNARSGHGKGAEAILDLLRCGFSL